MALENLQDSLPTYANDLKLNLSSVCRQTELSPQQLWGTLVACACACNEPTTSKAIFTEAAQNLSEVEMTAAKTAASIMGMNNVYYRFQHLTSNEKYRTMPARLRMNSIRSHGVDQKLFELWCLAVSAINACGMCVESHEKVLREQGVSEDAILASVRVAAVVHAVAAVMQTETSQK